jgi:hypothetical protein
MCFCVILILKEIFFLRVPVLGNIAIIKEPSPSIKPVTQLGFNCTKELDLVKSMFNSFLIFKFFIFNSRFIFFINMLAADLQIHKIRTNKVKNKLPSLTFCKLEAAPFVKAMAKNL